MYYSLPTAPLPKPLLVDNQPCRVENVAIDDLPEWAGRHKLRAVRRIGPYWPPVVYYERTDPHTDQE